MSSARAGIYLTPNQRYFYRKFGVVMEAQGDARSRPQRLRRLEVRRYSTLKSVAPDHPDTRALGVGGSAVSWPALTCCRRFVLTRLADFARSRPVCFVLGRGIVPRHVPLPSSLFSCELTRFA